MFLTMKSLVRNLVHCHSQTVMKSVSAVHAILPHPFFTANYNLLCSLLSAHCADWGYQVFGLGFIELCCLI